MINYTPFLDHIQQTGLKAWAEPLSKQLNDIWANLNDGNLPRLLAYLESLPDSESTTIEVSDWVTITGKLVGPQQPLEDALMKLVPWRKGPFNVLNTKIDSEWRCDLKWNRVKRHIGSLKGKHVLDVGSGNGYYGWQMKAAGAATVAGIDPSWLSVVQHLAINKYVNDPTHAVLPLTMESLTPNLEIFDSVFSMGVLYHRRSPLDHLFELRGALKPGGQLVLETIVIEGNDRESLVPIGRYARMNNVWFLPTAATLASWLEKMGFENIRIADISQTTAEEQRATGWKPGQSLTDYLDPEDPTKTVEGHPAPLRAILIADKPENARLKRYLLD